VAAGIVDKDSIISVMMENEDWQRMLLSRAGVN
jgi:hypothetical protein